MWKFDGHDPTLVRAYAEPLIAGLTMHAGLGTGGAFDAAGGRLAMHTAEGTSMPPHEVLSTYSVVDGTILGAVDLSAEGEVEPVYFARFM